MRDGASPANLERIASGVVAIRAALLISGCGRGERVTTNTLLAHNNCKGISAPIKLATLSEVAGYRGSELVQNGFEQGAATLNVDTIPSAGTQPAQTARPPSLPLFVALSKGVQPTRGFELHLADQALVKAGRHLEIPVYWTEPDATQPHPQVNTHPCLVVSVPNNNWQSIEAIDQHGQSLGVLSLPSAL